MIYKSVVPRLRLFLLIYILSCLIIGKEFFISSTARAEGLFPVYQAIEKNVLFWEKIYSTYSLNDAVIHDSEDLSKVYDVITLLDSDLPGAARLNQKAIQEAKEKYATILTNLNQRKPASPLEEKIASLFSGKNIKQQMQDAALRIRSQTGQKERFLAGVIRSGRYTTEIKRIFRSYNLPEDLAYLPHVESSFNVKAYSKFGAAGIWQFTRETGKKYLTVNYYLDERLDPIFATHAAAKYLQKSYRNLGDWPLAITSYNYGLAGTARAVKDKGSYIEIFLGYQQGHFKFASKNFYSEFLAALKVAKKIEKDKNIVPEPANNCRYLHLSGFLHIDDVASHFNVPKDTIAELNPGIRAPILSGEKLIPKGYSLRLPAQKHTSKKIVSLPSAVYHKQQKKSQFYRVKKGDTAISIARQNGISLTTLMKANNLDEYATIYIRQKLRIPGKSSLNSKDDTVLKLTARYKGKESSSSNGLSIPVLETTKKRRPKGKDSEYIPKKDPTVYNVFGKGKENGKTVGYITVQPEESVALYATWLESSISSILALNNLQNDDTIGPGQQLKLAFNTQDPTIFEDKRLEFLQETEDGFFSAYTVVGRQIYMVSDGDTFWDLCYNKFDIPLWLLERYNSTINFNKLTKNQKLVIPLVQPI